MERRPKVTVIGSANIDLVIRAHRQPKIGETITGESFHQFLGGKGANQAVAASRLGADVTFIGCVGKDNYGELILDNLKKESINTDHVLFSDHTETGTAHITVIENDNAITIIPGANYDLSSEHIERLEDTIRSSDVIVMQLEIPLETVSAAIQIAYNHSVPIILNPAPAVRLPMELLEKVTYITPNRTELMTLVYREVIDTTFEGITHATIDGITNVSKHEEAIRKLLSKGAQHVILTMGEKGVFFGCSQSEIIQHYAACQVVAVDTTGAGDTFNGALSVSIARGESITKAIAYANYAAALSITKLGAQTGMPTVEEVQNFIQQ